MEDTQQQVKFNRKSGSLFDRGSADSYYRRERRPHYRIFNPELTGPVYLEFEAQTEEEIAEYNAGFDENEANGEFKDWGY